MEPYIKGQDDRITVFLDDGRDVECEILTILDVPGFGDYIVLLPLDEAMLDDETSAYIYRYTEDEAGEPTLYNIESDDEYEAVNEVFDMWLDDQEYDEIIEEDQN